MPASSAQTAAYKRLLGQHRDVTAALVEAAWDNLDGYDEADVDEFTEATTPIFAAAKASAVALSAAFYALSLGIPAVGVDPATIAREPDFQGPFLATWHALAEGRPADEAVAAGRSTASAEAFHLVQSSARLTGDQVAAGRAVRWRRVPSANACDWCIQVAGQTYRSAESADFGHQRCGCAAVPA